MENYVIDFVSNMNSDGMTDDLWQIIKQDAQDLYDAKVCSEKQRNIYFYIDHFADDLFNEVGFKNMECRKDIVNIAFNALRDKESLEIDDIRAAICDAIKSISVREKVAYPNISGAVGLNRQEQRDVQKWINVLSEIVKRTLNGESKNAVENKLTEEWTPMEKTDFNSWAKYYAHKDHEKYAMVRDAEYYAMDEMALIDESEVARGRGRPRREKSPEESRRSLISRLDSAEKLLREFSHIWPQNTWNRLHQILSDLKREIMLLKSTASMGDRIIRSAALWERSGFKEGASLLMKIAEEDDVADQLERALSGKEYDASKEPQIDAIEGVGSVPDEDLSIPPEGAGEELPDMGELPPQEEELPPVSEELQIEEPQMEEPQIEEPQIESHESVNTKENPYIGATVEDIVSVLEPVVSELKVRVVARKLSKVDMMLDAQNIASHFPELGEAMAKVLESNTYVVTRLDKMITKLKGGLKTDSQPPENTAPSVDMKEITEQMPEVGLEVSEEASQIEMPAPPAAPKPLEVSEEAPAPNTKVPLSNRE